MLLIFNLFSLALFLFRMFGRGGGVGRARGREGERGGRARGVGKKTPLPVFAL